MLENNPHLTSREIAEDFGIYVFSLAISLEIILNILGLCYNKVFGFHMN